MALPTILINSATGSDSAASGAGPGTALTGTAAATDGTGLVVTLDGSPDLSGVAVDGSHVIYLADTTAGARNFGKITAKANSGSPTAQVTVANAFGTSLSGKSWAIGGKRASLASTSSAKLAENNSAAGDAMPGWTIEMESGHAETIAATLTIRRGGDTTDGAITYKGTSGAATMPCLTFSNNGTAISINLFTPVLLKDFELRNSNATKTASVGIVSSTSYGAWNRVDGIRINHATNKFWKAITLSGGGGVEYCNLDIANTVAAGIQSTGATFGVRIRNCWIRGVSAGAAIDITSSSAQPAFIIEDSIISGCTGSGIIMALTATATSSSMFGFKIERCTIHGNTVDGIRCSSTNTQICGWGESVIANNCITGNGGYGVNFSNGSPPTAAILAAYMFRCSNNCSGSGGTVNSSGFISVSGADSGTQAVDPGYVDSANGNFAVGVNVKGLGYPATIGPSSTLSYLDLGCAQRQEVAGGGIIG